MEKEPVRRACQVPTRGKTDKRVIGPFYWGKKKGATRQARTKRNKKCVEKGRGGLSVGGAVRSWCRPKTKQSRTKRELGGGGENNSTEAAQKGKLGKGPSPGVPSGANSTTWQCGSERKKSPEEEEVKKKNRNTKTPEKNLKRRGHLV